MQNVQDNCAMLLALTPLLAVHQSTSNVLQWHVMYVYNVTCSVDVCLCNAIGSVFNLHEKPLPEMINLVTTHDCISCSVSHPRKKKEKKKKREREREIPPPTPPPPPASAVFCACLLAIVNERPEVRREASICHRLGTFLHAVLCFSKSSVCFR